MMDKVHPPKNEIVTVNFSHAPFSSLDFLTFEDGADRLLQNVGEKLPLFAV